MQIISPPPQDTLHRLVKQAIDDGTAATVTEAEARFRRYRLVISIGQDEANLPQHQATLLTCVALARRVFLGGVSIEGALQTALRIPFVPETTLGEAVQRLGGAIAPPATGTPRVVIGGDPFPRVGEFAIRTACAGWRGGILPAHSSVAVTGGPAIPLAGMLAAALAVNEAFLFASGGTPTAGRRIQGLSLWDPTPNDDWLTSGADEPDLRYLPTRLWMIGLGHLGQAYAWALGLHNYTDPSKVHLVLQDIDRITPSTESTSILTDASLVGQKKTRAMAAWAEQRGFTTTIHERIFDASFRRQTDEPSIALCGIDNALGRQALDQVGFDLVVEVGLGRGHRDFRTLRLHALPGSRMARDIWNGHTNVEDVTSRSAYQQMLADGDLDQCGVTLLAGKAVGAPFVGAVGACLALSEVLRLLHGGPSYQLIDLDLQSIDQRQAVLNPRNFQGLNPGFAIANA